jgi:hypothetical protein
MAGKPLVETRAHGSRRVAAVTKTVREANSTISIRGNLTAVERDGDLQHQRVALGGRQQA